MEDDENPDNRSVTESTVEGALEESNTGETADDAVEPTEVASTGAVRSHVKLAAIIGIVLALALGGLTGWLGWNAYKSHKADEQRNLFQQVGRQVALNLTTIDFEHAEADVQRILDSATGPFHDDFQQRAAPFIDVVTQAKSKSVGNLTEAGLESDNENEGQVIVAVTVNTTNAGAPEQEPRSWRMRITVQKVNDEAKVSSVEFVP